MSPAPPPLASAVVPMNRMNREEFFGKLAVLDEERLKKALGNLYWRGNATMRERSETELDPGPSKQASRPVVDPDAVLVEVRDFVSLARSELTSAAIGVSHRRNEAAGAARFDGWRARQGTLWQ